MLENLGAPLFADRYRFVPIEDDWDTGRTGFTHPAFDILENRRVVIKRTDVASPQARQHEYNLQNESKALDRLKGLGVPELYAVNEAVYGEQKFTYLVMEYVKGTRVEKEILSLEPIERARIILELFRVIAKAHHRGIANGDIDIKHLFWNREEQKLCVIDWGNASITRSQRSHQFSFDMARSAEIIYALVTKEGVAPVTGLLTLPQNDKLLSSLLPLPEEFYKLCQWAPRNPSEEMHPPYSVLEMYALTKKWLSNLDPNGLYYDTELEELINLKPRPSNSVWKKFNLTGCLIIALVATISLSLALISFELGPSSNITPSVTLSITIQETLVSASPSQTPTSTSAVATVVPNKTQEAIETPIAILTPLVKRYTNILGFDNTLPVNFGTGPCWSTSSGLNNLSKRADGNWQFLVRKTHNLTDPIKVDFEKCFVDKQVSAIGLNFWSQRLGANSDFGLFVEYGDGLRREYLLQTESSDNTLHLIVKDIDGSSIDYIQLGIKPKLEGTTSLTPYYQFSAKLFLELNNRGSDLISFSAGTDLRPLTTGDLSNVNMKRVDIRPSLSKIESIGLIGHGSDIQIFLWPLVFYEDTSN